MAGVLQLIVPGLLGPLPPAAKTWDALRRPLPALSRVLARGRTERRDRPLDYTALLGPHFGLEAGAELPAGPLSLLGDGGEPGEGYWLRADPVHLQADRDRLMLFAPGAVAPGEAQALVAECNRLLVQDDYRLEAPTPERWYLRCPQPLALQTQPVDAVRGRYVDDYLPQGPDARRWMALMTELQMVLHGAWANHEREAGGALPINGIWCWGGGVLPRPSRRWSAVLAEEPVLKGLALASDSAWQPLPREATSLPAGDVLVALTLPRQALQGEDFEAWLAELASFDVQWLAPLLAGLGERELVLEWESGSVRVSGRALGKFWRRRPWRSYLEF